MVELQRLHLHVTRTLTSFPLAAENRFDYVLIESWDLRAASSRRPLL